MSAQARLKELGLTLPQAPQPKGSYCTWRQAGEWITLSGQGPLVEGVLRYTGRVGVDLTVEQGYDAARLSALNLLAVLRQAAGGLERVELVRVLALSPPDPILPTTPECSTGPPSLFLSVLGVRGRHSRSAVGVYGLPFGLRWRWSLPPVSSRRPTEAPPSPARKKPGSAARSQVIAQRTPVSFTRRARI